MRYVLRYSVPSCRACKAILSLLIWLHPHLPDVTVLCRQRCPSCPPRLQERTPRQGGGGTGELVHWKHAWAPSEQQAPPHQLQKRLTSRQQTLKLLQPLASDRRLHLESRCVVACESVLLPAVQLAAC